jgi:3-hydroxy-9,10-secoandrosta-1,3,5(10)-triene-9,17-dione monooxygenase reductase component
MSEHEVDPSSFKAACGQFPTGVMIFTISGNSGEAHGLTVNSFASVSMDPPLVLVCIHRESTIMAEVAIGRYFGLNILSDVDRIEGITGVPLLENVSGTLECSICELRPTGDHVIIIGHVVKATTNNHWPLTYVNRRYSRIERVAEPHMLVTAHNSK